MNSLTAKREFALPCAGALGCRYAGMDLRNGVRTPSSLEAGVFMPRVRFLPSETTVDCALGSSLFDAGAQAGISIETACVGKGTCGLCRVKVIAGGEGLSPYTEEEERHLGNLYHLTKVRLSCRTRVTGDVTIELAPRRRAVRK